MGTGFNVVAWREDGLCRFCALIQVAGSWEVADTDTETIWRGMAFALDAGLRVSSLQLILADI